MFYNKYNLKFGCDPEFFITYADSGKELAEEENVSDSVFAIPSAQLAINDGLAIIGGDEKHPIYFDNSTGRVIGDGVAFEINLKKPYADPKDMWGDVSDLLDRFVSYQHEKLNGRYAVMAAPAINFDYQRFWTSNLTENETLYWATIFGCDPDTDAFESVNDELAPGSCIIDASKHPFRYGGGHLHISGDEDIVKYPVPLIKLLALTVGNYSIARSGANKEEKLRAKYYGKAGKFRVQKYKGGVIGVEYRTPSDAWLTWSTDSFMQFFDLINYSMYMLKNPEEGKKILDEFAEPTKQAIATADKRMATQILNQLGV